VKHDAMGCTNSNQRFVECKHCTVEARGEDGTVKVVQRNLDKVRAFLPVD